MGCYALLKINIFKSTYNNCSSGVDVRASFEDFREIRIDNFVYLHGYSDENFALKCNLSRNDFFPVCMRFHLPTDSSYSLAFLLKGFYKKSYTFTNYGRSVLCTFTVDPAVPNIPNYFLKLMFHNSQRCVIGHLVICKIWGNKLLKEKRVKPLPFKRPVK